MNSHEDIRDHLNNFLDVVGKLEDMDVTIHPELLSIMMLYSLPASYENFRIAIESRDVLPNPEELKVKIIEENEARRQIDTNDNPQMSRSEALYAKQKRKIVICKNCNKKGHTTEACWSKKGATNPQKHKHREKNFNICFALEEKCGDNLWCLDSGCSSHMTGKGHQFTNLTPEVNTLTLAAKKHTTQIKGKGKICVSSNNDKYNLNDTLYVPEISTNLMSVGKITDNGYKVLFEKEKASIIEADTVVLQASRKTNGLYYLDFEESETANLTVNSQDESMMWHRKLGHINEKDLKMMVSRQMMRGLNLKEVKLDTCETCIKGKLSSLPFPSHDRISSETLEIIHSDVCGPFEDESLAGSKYYVSFIDDFSRYCCIYFIRNKSEVIEKFKEYKNGVELFMKKKIQYLQSDNGGEYRSKVFDDLLKQCGIRRRLTAPYTPQQNGVSERKNRSLLDKARCLMMESNAPSYLWAEAINTANYLINRSPAKALNGSTPYEKWVGRNPAGNHLHIFGSKAFILNKRRRGKFSPKATEGVFMGYAKNAKGFRIYLPDQNDVVISRDVKFVEKMYYYDTRTEAAPDNSRRKPENRKEMVIKFNNKNNNPNSTLPIQDSPPSKDAPSSAATNSPTNYNDNVLPTEDEGAETADQYQISPEILTEDEGAESDGYQTSRETATGTTSQRPKRSKKKPLWTKDYDLQDDMEDSMLVSEMSYISDHHDTEDDWHDAIKAEIRAHIKNETWKITKKESGEKVIDYKLVLKTKTGPNNVETKKARLVARGFTQRPGIDYNETFAPVAKLSSIRTVVGMSVQEGMKLKQMDVTTAYLNGDIDENISMKVPENLEKYVTEIMIDESEQDDLLIYNKARNMLECLRNIKGEKVCKLQRSLYGLKQSGRQWYIRLDKELRNIGFVPSQADPCVYILQKGGAKIITAIWVDDLLIAYTGIEKMQEIQEMLANKFEIKDLGIPQKMLGIDFTKQSIKLCQEKYIKDTLIKFKMDECKPTSTPIEPGLSLEIDKNSIGKELPYKNLIGTLMYLAVATRPDIMFAVSYLSQFNDCYNAEHFKSAKRVLRYLKGTSEIGIIFKKTGQELYGMADADWGACKVDRKSFSGYCFIYAGGCISWSSRKQKSVALSTAEAEYCSITEAAKEAIHLKSLFNDLGARIECVQISNDNQAALKLSQNPIVTGKSKHIDLKMHYIRNCIQDKQICLRYLETKKMAADLLTKGLAGPRLKELMTHLGLA